MQTTACGDNYHAWLSNQQARLDALLERGEDQGCVNLSELSDIVRDLELDDDEAGELHARTRGARASR